jgi:dTDP-4-dehydrorhamnose reductase
VLAHKFDSDAAPTEHTFNRRRKFPDSVPFDLFRHDIARVLPLAEIDVIIFASRFEDCPDAERVSQAMSRCVAHLKDKRVVYISTDAVFDGSRGMYREGDFPSPRTRCGTNKLLCETLVRRTVSDHCVLRTSYIYGYSLGTLDPRLGNAQRILRERTVFERFEDMYKSPIEVNRLADVVVALIRLEFSGTVHAAGARVSVHDFFRRALGAVVRVARTSDRFASPPYCLPIV